MLRVHLFSFFTIKTPRALAAIVPLGVFFVMKLKYVLLHPVYFINIEFTNVRCLCQYRLVLLIIHLFILQLKHLQHIKYKAHSRFPAIIGYRTVLIKCYNWNIFRPRSTNMNCPSNIIPYQWSMKYMKPRDEPVHSRTICTSTASLYYAINDITEIVGYGARNCVLY